MSLQNLRESYLYSLLPEGVIDLDTKGLLQAVVGGVQDRLEDIRSYAKKYELFFDTHGLSGSNNVVLAAYITPYGTTVTRSLDINDSTPVAEGADLTAWAAGQMGVDVAQITSCVFGVDLLRFVDINTLTYLAANVGAVLYATAAQRGTEQLNQQRILDSYFPRLKIKGTVQSFDVLGKLLGFDDIRIVGLWGRLSPRIPDDFGHPANDADFADSPAFQPQQVIGVPYNPFAMRDGPFYNWTGTVSADQASSFSYEQAVNGFQPWVQVLIVGTIVHPPVGAVAVLAGGGPHVKATAAPGTGLIFQALGEGDSFNGLEIRFASWNNGTDRLVTIQDRLSAIKYRTSYFDVVATVTDERAIEQFGTLSARRNADLAAHPALTVDGVAQPPYRPWQSGSSTTAMQFLDYGWHVLDGTDTPKPSRPRTQATSAQTQVNVTGLQQTVLQYVQALDEVRPATRQARKIQVGFLDVDSAEYAAYLATTTLGTLVGTSTVQGVASPSVPMPVTLSVLAGGVLLAAESDSTGSIVSFNNGTHISGTYNLATSFFKFTSAQTGTNVLVAEWLPTSTEVVRAFAGTAVLSAYQARPEDQSDDSAVFESVDEFPWRKDMVNGGDLVEVVSHPASTVEEFSIHGVQNAIAMRDHSGVEYNVYGVASTVLPVRVIKEVKPTDATYLPGQLAIGYQGKFKGLDSVPATDFALPGRKSTDRDVYFQTGAQLFHVGLAQGVMVADLPGFFGPPHRSGLVGWLPLNEHPDEGDVAADVSSTSSQQTVAGFQLTGSFADRLWSAERGWYLNVRTGGTVFTPDHRDITTAYSLSLWVKPDPTLTSTGTLPIFSHGPVQLSLPDNKDLLILNVLTTAGTQQTIASLPIHAGTFSNVAVTLLGQTVQYGVAPLASTLALSTTNMGVPFTPFEDAGDALVITSGSNRPYGIQDVRVWNQAKVQADLNRVHNPAPTPTICTYWPTNIEIVSTGDRYGLEVTPAGFVYPSQLPPAVRLNRLARITRYNSMGRYEGENRFKEVGLGGGTLLPPVYKLGQQFYGLTATGTTVVSTLDGQLPGYNPLWEAASGFPNTRYVVLPMSGSGANGITGTTAAISVLPGEGNFWPHQTQSTNPCREVIYVKGDEGTVHEVSLRSTGPTTAELVGSIAPSGAQVLLASNGTELTCNRGGYVYQRFTGAPVNTPPLFMYLNSRTTDDVQDALTTWTSRNDSTSFGSKQTPPIAALNDNGVLEFENTSNLTSGFYRLTIESGNIGKADADFDGFSVEISVDSLLIVGKLCQGLSGSDFVGTDTFEFFLPEVVPANWFLDINWLNAFSNPARGVARQLAIFSYKLERIQTDLYRVDIAASGTLPALTKLDTTVYAGNVPGGWLATVNSYGTVCQWRHESQVYPSNDTVTSIVPLSSILTATTSRRREDQILTSNVGVTVLVDGTDASLPVFSGTIIVV